MTRRSWLLMGLLAALWGASYMFIKIALHDDVPAPSIVFIRVTLGAALLTAIAAHQHALTGLRGRWRWVWAIGIVQVAGPFLLITYGEKWIPSALAGILVASAPIFVALLSPRFAASEAVHGWAVVGIAVGILGVMLLFGVDLSGSAKLALGGGMVLLAGLGYAFGAIWVRWKMPGAPPVAIAAGTMITAAIVTLPLAATHLPPHAISLGASAALLALGAGGTGIAFLIYYVLIADVGANRASVVAYLAPGFSVLYGALFLSEPITAATIGGLALILAGSWIAAEGRAPWQRRTTVPAATSAAAEVAMEPLAEDLVGERVS